MTYTSEQVIAAMTLSEIDKPYQETVLDYLKNMNVKYHNLTDCQIVIQIFESILQITGIDYTQIQGKSRSQRILMCRHMAAFLLRKYTTKGLKDIGIILGIRHHTTVIHSLSVHDLMVETKDKHYTKFYDIENDLNINLGIMNQL